MIIPMMQKALVEGMEEESQEQRNQRLGQGQEASYHAGYDQEGRRD